MQPRPPRHRWLMLAAGLLLVGAAINIAIAWVRDHPDTIDIWRATPEDVDAPAGWPRTVPAHWPPAQWWAQLQQVQRGHRRIYIHGMLNREDGFDAMELVQVQSGWPAPLLERELRAETRYTYYSRPIRLYEPPDALWPGGLQLGERRYPIRPLWPGFVINTVLYAALAAAVWASPRPVRCWSRQRRQLCISCGYSREGLPSSARCPECGRGPKD